MDRRIRVCRPGEHTLTLSLLLYAAAKMAVLLAPYNDAMRLGMGCASTTRLRWRVVRASASAERIARPQYKFGQMTGLDGGNVDISQDVTWTAKFVDRISEVSDSLNIKCDAVGGGGKASASFIDTNKFQESDINYFIQVRVTNQLRTAPDLIEFALYLQRVSSRFEIQAMLTPDTGFTEGGEFNALISIKLKDRSKTKEIKGDLEVNMNFSAVSVSGKGALEKKDASKGIEGETTIAVSWKGGGDIKDATVSDWTLSSLKSVAMEFPEHVMACPLKTKCVYAATRLEPKIIVDQRHTDKVHEFEEFLHEEYSGVSAGCDDFSDLVSVALRADDFTDYENAGVYSSALLDAYMDYKVMWRNIQQATWEIEQNQTGTLTNDSSTQLKELATGAKANYEAQLAKYKAKRARLEQQAKEQSALAQPSNPDPSSGSTLLIENKPIQSSSPQPDNAPSEAVIASAPLPTSVSTVQAPVSSVSTPTTTVPAPVTPAPARVAPYVPPLLIGIEAEEPLPPNDLNPYTYTTFSLDKARRDCRFEMIKIVREVDAVAADPKVACDPDRSWQYLSPAVFRILLPVRADAEAAKAKLLLDEKQKKELAAGVPQTEKDKEIEKLELELKDAKYKRLMAEREVAAMRAAVGPIETLKSPHIPWCPVPVRTPIRIFNAYTKQCLQYSNFQRARQDPPILSQAKPVLNADQRFYICPVGPRAFSILHIAADMFLATASQDSDLITMAEFPTFVSFEPTPGIGNPATMTLIHLADTPGHTISLNYDGNKLIKNTRNKSEIDSWIIKDWNELAA
ncbi:unnamed protein product [Mycena citricolor]|uniref:Uncharacterized protein n=1 Tax=Mycena citricolor TaxID=2018698 RepID=A0AAD2Q404_9AGAR|nr:unnamed protein product [Mycena citricolor]